jgi:Ca2+/Na+ antiporter
MTEFELISVLKETSNGIAQDFEFFLTATFALIIVSYTVGERLGKAPRVAITSLYLAMVVLLLVRYQGQATQALFATSVLREMKSDYPTLDTVILMWFRRFIFVAGTLVAVYSIFKPVVISDKEEDDENGT